MSINYNSLITGALGFTLALSWNRTIDDSIYRLYPTKHFSMIISSLITTIIILLIIILYNIILKIFEIHNKHKINIKYI